MPEPRTPESPLLLSLYITLSSHIRRGMRRQGSQQKPWRLFTSFCEVAHTFSFLQKKTFHRALVNYRAAGYRSRRLLLFCNFRAEQVSLGSGWSHMPI